MAAGPLQDGISRTTRTPRRRTGPEVAEAGEHRGGHGRYFVGIGRRSRQLADLGAGEEGRRPHLDRDVSDSAAVGHDFGGHLTGEPFDMRRDRCRIGDVGGERLLLAATARHVRLIDDR